MWRLMLGWSLMACQSDTERFFERFEADLESRSLSIGQMASSYGVARYKLEKEGLSAEELEPFHALIVQQLEGQFDGMVAQIEPLVAEDRLASQIPFNVQEMLDDLATADPAQAIYAERWRAMLNRARQQQVTAKAAAAQEAKKVVTAELAALRERITGKNVVSWLQTSERLKACTRQRVDEHLGLFADHGQWIELAGLPLEVSDAPERVVSVMEITEHTYYRGGRRGSQRVPDKQTLTLFVRDRADVRRWQVKADWSMPTAIEGTDPTVYDDPMGSDRASLANQIRQLQSHRRGAVDTALCDGLAQAMASQPNGTTSGI